MSSYILALCKLGIVIGIFSKLSPLTATVVTVILVASYRYVIAWLLGLRVMHVMDLATFATSK
jgi:hypothetical protein